MIICFSFVKKYQGNNKKKLHINLWIFHISNTRLDYKNELSVFDKFVGKVGDSQWIVDQGKPFSHENGPISSMIIKIAQNEIYFLIFWYIVASALLLYNWKHAQKCNNRIHNSQKFLIFLSILDKLWYSIF